MASYPDIFKNTVRPALEAGFATFKAAPTVPVLGLVVMVGASVVASVPVSILHLGLLSPLVMMPVSAFFAVHYLSMLQRLQEGGTAEISEMFAMHPRFKPYLITHVVVSLAVTVGSMLLLIPGLIAAVALGMAPFFALFGELGPRAALEASVALAKAQTATVVTLMATLVVINMIGVCLLGVGLLVTVPVTVFAALQVYRGATGGAAKRKKGTGRVRPAN